MQSKLSFSFVNPGKLEYPEPSYEPIFPASVPKSYGNSTFYYTPHRSSIILGYVDTAEFQLPDEPDQWLDMSGLPQRAVYLKGQERGVLSYVLMRFKYWQQSSPAVATWSFSSKNL